jgi:hypothetical protein
MAFRTLGEVLQTARAQGMIDGLGEDTVGAVSLRPLKRTPTKAGAKFQGDNVMQGGKPGTGTHSACPPTIGRDRRTGEHPQLGHAPAPLVRRSMLTVIEGGRRAGGGGRSPAYRDGSWRERARATGLRVVG